MTVRQSEFGQSTDNTVRYGYGTVRYGFSDGQVGSVRFGQGHGSESVRRYGHGSVSRVSSDSSDGYSSVATDNRQVRYRQLRFSVSTEYGTVQTSARAGDGRSAGYGARQDDDGCQIQILRWLDDRRSDGLPGATLT